MSDTAEPAAISDDDMAAFGAKLAAWRATLDARERLILDEMVARAITWTHDDARGFGGDWGTWFDNIPDGVWPPGHLPTGSSQTGRQGAGLDFSGLFPRRGRG